MKIITCCFFINYNPILNIFSSFNNSGENSNYAQRDNIGGEIIKDYRKILMKKRYKAGWSESVY